MAVYGYVRVSTAAQVEDGESLGVQERQIQGWCLMHNQPLEHTFIEEGVSASIPVDKRPQGKALMDRAKRGDTILVARLDRLFRSALDALQTVEKAQSQGITIFVIDGLGDITGNGMGRAFMTISAAFAELERETLKERVRAVKRDQRERGRYLGGKVPFGFRLVYDETGNCRKAELVPVPEEHKVIALIHQIRDLPLRKIRETIEAEHNRALSLETINRIRKVSQ